MISPNGIGPSMFLVLWAVASAASAAEPSLADRDFLLTLEVSGLPPRASFVPISTPIDFTAILKEMKIAGAIDERSLRLGRLMPEGRSIDQLVQFDPESQSGVAAPRAPGIPAASSVAAAFRPSDTPAGVRQTGALSWIAQADDRGQARYQLRFRVPGRGVLIQVPFPPYNLRWFDDEGRAAPVAHFPRMQIRPQSPLAGAVEILDGRQRVTSYHVGPASAASDPSAPRRPFFYPVNGADGVSLTEFGKPHDPTGSHSHHYGLWIAHAQVAGQDFWSERGGSIVHAQLDRMDDGPVFCRLVHATRWIAKGVEYLQERRTVRVWRSAGDWRLADIELEFRTARPEPVELGKTTFGFLAARVAQSMTPFDGGGEIVDARGRRNEQNVHLARAEWLDQSGPLVEEPGRAGGRWGGIAILDHPANPHHPTVWHCRNDGWAGAAFNGQSPYTLRPGEVLRLRYRVCLHRGNALESHIADRFAEYAAPVACRVGAARAEDR